MRSIRQITAKWRTSAVVQPLWHEHGLPLLLYLALSLALTWPLAKTFTTQIPGESYDAYNGLWVMWHVKEALLGRQPFFSLPLLYYPSGATLLTHVPGPLTGFFALPFWPLGPEAAHNAAVLISFTLTGYTMYLLARALGFVQSVAFFAGVVLLAAPMHLVGLWGHTTKVFLGITPLVLLGLHHTLDLNRSQRAARWWAVATAVALLLTMLHDSFQFLITAAAIGFFTLAAFWMAPRAGRLVLLRRALLLAVCLVIITGPLFLATAIAAYAPELDLDRNLDSFNYQPDLVEFLLPPAHGRLFGSTVTRLLAAYNLEQGIETAVSLSWIGLALSATALARGRRQAHLWLLFTFIWLLLSLGPALKVLGRLHFTQYGLPIILPYAFVTELPGLSFLRTPGRFMQIGYAGFAIAASFGLAWLMARWPKQARLFPVAAILLLLLENWPQPWPRLALRPTPAFYHHIAQDQALYGVLDLPVTPALDVPPIMYNAHYQMYQMTHRKGITMGYISRTYESHPVLPCVIPELEVDETILINGQPARCYLNAHYDLAQANYRYVVWHKPKPWYEDYQPGAWGEQEAAVFIDKVFAGQAPLLDDDLTTVYAVPPWPDETSLTTMMTPLHNWYRVDSDGVQSWRWARSPATLQLASPQHQSAVLEITPSLIYEAGLAPFLGSHGLLRLEMDNGFSAVVDIHSDQTTTIPLDLPTGVHTLTLILEAGVFQPSRYGSSDHRWLSFAVHSINLQTEPHIGRR